jgi:hypothetical protein
LINGFGAVGLDYVFTGALAVSFYGVPRTTADIDVLVAVSGKDFRVKLVSALRQAGLEVDEKQVDLALASNYRIATFRVSKSPYRVDVIFSPEKFERRAGSVAGLATFFQTPEDLILAMLRMIKATVPRERAFKDEEDILAILRYTRVDVEAVKKQARKSSTLAIFESLAAQ